MVESSSKQKEAKQKAREEETGANAALERELELLEAKIEELKILYEQFFVDILPHPPDQLRAEVVRTIRKLLRAPFRNSTTRFRLRTLVQRYQTYSTYWERVNKQREEGTYFRDVFKAEVREKVGEQAKAEAQTGSAEKAMRQLFKSYESALSQAGQATKNLNYDAFKQSLLKKAKDLREQHGVKRLRYKIVVKASGR